MTEEEEYSPRDARRVWSDRRAARLIEQGYMRTMRNGQQQRILMRLLQYMRDDYEELLERNREEYWGIRDELMDMKDKYEPEESDYE